MLCYLIILGTGFRIAQEASMLAMVLDLIEKKKRLDLALYSQHYISADLVLYR